ncbi:MAG: Asp/Glu racemase [Pseudomonadota bacterium]
MRKSEAAPRRALERAPYQALEEAIPRLGLIALQTDETIERDFRRLFPAEAAYLYVSRVPSGADATPESLRAMEKALPAAAALLPPPLTFDAVGYGCTSASALIGPDRVRALIRGAVSARAVADPTSAAIEACAALGLRRLAYVSPYIDSVSLPAIERLEAAGLSIVAGVSFHEESETVVAKIDPVSIREAALSVGRGREVEAVFISCTQLRALEVVEEIEATLGKPALCSNLCLAWSMARAAGAPLPDAAPGRIASL